MSLTLLSLIMMSDFNDIEIENAIRQLDIEMFRSITKIQGHVSQKDMYQCCLACVEKYIILKTLVRFRFNQTRTSKSLGISRGTLRKKMKVYGIIVEEKEDESSTLYNTRS